MTYKWLNGILFYFHNKEHIMEYISDQEFVTSLFSKTAESSTFTKNSQMPCGMSQEAHGQIIVHTQ